MTHPLPSDGIAHPRSAAQAMTVDEIMARLRSEVVGRGGILPEAAVHPGHAVALPQTIALARWQPAAPRIPVKQAYELSELLSFSDKDFIDNAYRAVLRRTPDAAGLGHHLTRLRNGQSSKVEVLAALRWSPEGEKEGVHVDGLLAPYLLQKWRRKPVVGPVLGWLQSMARLSRLSDRQVVLDSAQAREAQELGRIVNLQAEQLEQRIARMEGVASTNEGLSESLAGRLDSVAAMLGQEIGLLSQQVARLERQLSASVERIDSLRIDQASNVAALSTVRDESRQFAEQVGVVSSRLDGMEHVRQQAERFSGQVDAVNARLDELSGMRVESRQFAEQVGVVSSRLDGMEHVRQQAERFSDQVDAVNARLDEVSGMRAESRQFAEQVGVVSSRLDGMEHVRLQAEKYASQVEELSARLDLAADLGYRIDTIGARLDGMPDVVPVVRLVSERVDLLSGRDATLSAQVEQLASQLKPLLELDSQAQAKSSEMDALLVAFEDAFRGGRQAARARAEPYLELIRESGAGSTKAPILDLASGRGEWLELLKEGQLIAQGVDSNRVFAEACRGKGLQVAHDDAAAWLSAFADGSAGAVTAMRLAEYLPLEKLVQILDEGLRVLRPGGLIMLHGFNPEGIVLATGPVRHQQPLPAEVMRWLLEARGFYGARIARPVNVPRDASVANVAVPRRLSLSSTAVVPFESAQATHECAVIARKLT